jgi:hypothetical protein
MPFLRKTTAKLCLFWLLAACAPLQGAPPVFDRQTIQAIPPGVTQPEITAGGVAVLEPFPQNGAEGMRNNMAFEIFQGLRVGFPEAKIHSRIDTDALLVQAGLRQEVAAFLKDYHERRHVDWGLMSRVGVVLNVRYLFVSKIAGLEKKTDIRMLDKGEEMVEGKPTVFSSGPNMIPDKVTKKVDLHGELWDLRCRAVVWTGEGSAGLTEPAGEERLRVEDLFIRAGRLLVGSLQRSLAPAGKGETC